MPTLSAFRTAALALLLGASSVRAQPAAATDSASRRATSRGAGPLIGWRDRVTFASLAGAGAVVSPFDTRLARAIRGSGPQGSAGLRDAARAFNSAGDPGALAGAVLLFGVGHLTGSAATARLGAHAGEAIVLGGSTAAAIKLLAGRNRPNVDRGDADAFAPGRGYEAGRTSFPSGHTTAAFAFASAVATDLRITHPHAARIASPLLYGGAALVGVARMYDDKHWASDVAVGAAVGTLAGRVTTAYARAHPHGWLERLVH